MNGYGKTDQMDSVELLNHDMAEKNLSGYWSLGMEGLPSEPMTSVKPCLWKWRDVHQSLVRAGEVISLENSERRVVRLVNPGLDRRHGFATHTLQISFQYVSPEKMPERIAIRRPRSVSCSRQRSLHNRERPAMRDGAGRSHFDAEAHLA